MKFKSVFHVLSIILLALAGSMIIPMLMRTLDTIMSMTMKGISPTLPSP